MTLSEFRDGKAAEASPTSSMPSPPGNDVNNILMSNAKKAAGTTAKRSRDINSVLLAGAKSQKSTKEKITADSSRKRTNSWSTKASHNNYGSAPPKYKIIKTTNLNVDGFHYANKNRCKTYFLTHFHSDHYGGIDKNWDAGTIYCSPITAKLVIQELRVDPKYIHPIQLNRPFTVVSPDCLGMDVTVTLINANHCPGAILFFFTIRNPSKPKSSPITVLHVGDFRWDREFMQKNDVISKICSRRIRLNELYLDTTYCDAKYNFPAQRQSIDAALQCVKLEGMGENNDTLFVFGAYTIGKEKIFMSVAKAFGKKIFVDGRRDKVLRTFLSEEDAKLLTRDRNETNVWVVGLGGIVNKGLKESLDDANKRGGGGLRGQRYSRVVGFRPSGWTYSGKKKKKDDLLQTTLDEGSKTKEKNKAPEIVAARKSGVVSIYGVPYSEHSSFGELVDCLLCLTPQNIVPTVKAGESREQVSLLLDACRAKIKEEKENGCDEEEDKSRRGL